MSEPDSQQNAAIHAANQALSGRRRRRAGHLASIDLRFFTPKTGPWEVLAMVSLAVTSILLVLGIWSL
ncbi:MAG TPA: hypothetical protein VGJ84_18185 [Polyangiaceae bacterium]|jgi:hypothetical protein